MESRENCHGDSSVYKFQILSILEYNLYPGYLVGFIFFNFNFLIFKAALPVFVSVTLLTSERGLDFNGHILRLRVCLKRGALQQASHDEHEVVKNT